MPIVSVPPPYRGPTGGAAEIEVEATTLRDCLRAVDARHPGFGELIFDGDGRLHGFVRLFLNDEPVKAGGLDGAVAVGDRVTVVAAIGGGSAPCSSIAKPCDRMDVSREEVAK